MKQPALGVGLLLLTTWLGVNATWGLTSPQDTLVSGFERQIAPLAAWVGGAVVLLVLAVLLAGRRQDRSLLAVSAMLLAYLVGVVASRYAKLAVDPPGGLPLENLADAGRALFERSFLLIPALPMLVVGYYLCRKDLPLRFGDWSKETGTWGRTMLWALLLIGVPGFLLMQSTVEFAPVKTGSLWPALLPVLALALLNAFTEELLFRGLLQTPLVGYLGARWGVLLQAVFFAIHHWGASPSLIAGAPTALILAFAAVWMGWSKSSHTGFARKVQDPRKRPRQRTRSLDRGWLSRHRSRRNNSDFH